MVIKLWNYINISIYIYYMHVNNKVTIDKVNNDNHMLTKAWDPQNKTALTM